MGKAKPRPSHSARLVTAALLVTAWASGVAHAQTCSSPDRNLTVCRVALSQPRRFTLDVEGRLTRTGSPAIAALEIRVDGQLCLRQSSKLWGSHPTLHGRCPVDLRPTVHQIVARVDGHNAQTDAVVTSLRPSPRLATLPREASDLFANLSSGHHR